MAILEYRGEQVSDPAKISAIMGDQGMAYEHWGVKGAVERDEDVLNSYKAEIEQLKTSRGYVTADLVALSKELPNLDAICAKFDKEHHHTEDEVRFVVEGEGVFELLDSGQKEFIKFTSQPGDLVVIPANRRHLFYLTDKRFIRCIRLFKNQDGWEAIYEKPDA